MEEQDLSQEDEVFRGLFEDGRYTKLTAMEKKEYKKSVLEYTDVQDAIRCAQENFLKLGIEEGREEGREQGREQGRKEATKQLVRSLLDNGFDVPTIVKVTGLAEEAILAIKEGNPSHKQCEIWVPLWRRDESSLYRPLSFSRTNCPQAAAMSWPLLRRMFTTILQRTNTSMKR